ncbi:MAG: glycosyltransferase family 2 protein [Clostridia bacterium]|nr:glycosyltransferase family 2 protein [Clostridia bacterium]
MQKRINGVTIIMPAYNAEATINQAIQSVIKQSYAAWELIVIDDKSCDKTSSIVQSFITNDPRIRLISNQQNKGVSVSRNIGVALAQYQWIAFLDSDDYWEQNKLSKQIEALQEHKDCKLCFTGTRYLCSGGDLSHYILQVPSKVFGEDILRQNVISCSSVLVEKEALLRNPMPNIRTLHEDLATWYKILKSENKESASYAVGINEPLLVYRLSSSGKSGNKLKSAVMQWKTYRYLGISFFKSVACFISYVVRNVNKYRKIRKQGGGLAQI